MQRGALSQSEGWLLESRFWSISAPQQQKSDVEGWCSELNGDPQKRSAHNKISGTSRHYHIWEKGLCKCNEVKDIEMSSLWIIQMGPKSNDQCLPERQTL